MIAVVRCVSGRQPETDNFDSWPLALAQLCACNLPIPHWKVVVDNYNRRLILSIYDDVPTIRIPA
jgi:hypothetical protein